MLNTWSCQKKSDQEQFGETDGELIIPEDAYDGNNALQSQENTLPCVVSSLSARESEAILVIKQLQDQVVASPLLSCFSEIKKNKYLNKSQADQVVGGREEFYSN